MKTNNSWLVVLCMSLLVSLSVSQNNSVEFVYCEGSNCLYNSTVNGTLLPQQTISFPINFTNSDILFYANAALTAWVGYLSSLGNIQVYFTSVSYFDNSTTTREFGIFFSSCDFNESCSFGQYGDTAGSCLDLEEDDEDESSVYAINVYNAGTGTVDFVINLAIQEGMCTSSSGVFAWGLIIYFGAPFFLLALTCCVFCYACRRRYRCRTRGYTAINDRNSKVVVEQSSVVYAPQPQPQVPPPSYSTNAYYQGPPPSYSVATANNNYAYYQQPQQLYPNYYQNTYPQPPRYQ